MMNALQLTLRFETHLLKWRIITHVKALALILVLAGVQPSVCASITDPACNGVLRGVALDSQNRPVSEINLELWPIGIDLAYILPSTKTTDTGEYSFANVCPGRFIVVVDDERAGYPSSFWNRLLGFGREGELTPAHSQIELPVAVPPKAASVQLIARDKRTNVLIGSLKVRVRTSQIKMYDWITLNYDSGRPLFLPANIDLIYRVGAEGYHEWRGDRKSAQRVRLAPDDHVTLALTLRPRR